MKNVEMSFFNMVAFMVKWALASIPAFIILAFFFAFMVAVLGGIGWAGMGLGR